MSDFRGPLPLNDRDFAEVRRNVLAKIEKRPPVMRWMLAAAAVIALVVIFIPRPQPVKVAPHPVPLRGADRSSFTSPAGRGRGAAAGEGPARVAKKPTRKKKPQPQQLVASKSAGAPPSDEDITMNIQTADPNIRIIWIARR